MLLGSLLDQTFGFERRIECLGAAARLGRRRTESTVQSLQALRIDMMIGADQAALRIEK